MKALVVGYGSIGARHTRLLEERGLEVSVLSRRAGVHPRPESDLRAALECGYVVVASETARHEEHLRELRSLGYAGPVLVEKPLFAKPAAADPPGPTWVAYQMRFDPLLAALRLRLEGRVYSAQARSASYLPDWRPHRDYRQSESASRAAGGGVLRDLSHELDYLSWLFGPLEGVVARGGRVSELEIDSDDCWHMLAGTPRCPALSLALNYLDRPEDRWLVVNAADGTWRLDFMARTLSLDGRLEMRDDSDYDAPYRALHEAVLAGGGSACTYAEGRALVELIARIEGQQ